MVSACLDTHAQQYNKIQEAENLRVFAKMYGYVRWFHPSDEASSIDWDRFAVYGSQQIRSAKNEQELQRTLNELFAPLVHGLQWKCDNYKTNRDSVIPSSLPSNKISFWQHQGIQIKGDSDVLYRSSRVNSLMKLESLHEDDLYFSTYKLIDIHAYIGRDFIIQGYGKVKNRNAGEGNMWCRIDTDTISGGYTIFHDLTGNNPINTEEWKPYTLKGKIPPKSKYLYFGGFTNYSNALYLDDLSLCIKNKKGKWDTIYVNHFESMSDSLTEGLGFDGLGESGFQRIVSPSLNGSHAMEMWFDRNDQTYSTYKGEALFTSQPHINESIEVPINKQCRYLIPLCLYSDSAHIFSKSAKEGFDKLKERLADIEVGDTSNIDVKLGSVIVCWNIFQHFYPYWDITPEVNWTSELNTALERCLIDRSFLPDIVKELSAKVKDGHVSVFCLNNTTLFLPPFSWEWIEGKLTITNAWDKKSNLKRGDIITKIDNLSPKDFFAKKALLVAASTKGLLDELLTRESLFGSENSSIDISVERENEATKEVSVKRTIDWAVYEELMIRKNKPFVIKSDVSYIDLTRVNIGEIKVKIKELKRSKAIICDLRGYPTEEMHEFISYLLPIDDTCKSWLRVPQYIYPDHKESSFASFEWLFPKDSVHHITSKAILMIDGSAVSYSESIIGFFEHYKLATIIGQPSAGTNGDINTMYLPGNICVNFTGMRMFKMDGSQLHGVGFTPDIIVPKTHAGVSAGKDEQLEAAYKLAREIKN